jgi:uncharacterized protein YjbJ (UPF0337 family)
MNEHRVIGSGRAMFGSAEQTLGEAVGSDQIATEGLIDRAAGAVENGYGKARDTLADIAGDAPERLDDLVGRGRDFADRADRAVRRELGDSGPLYLLAGAAALVGLGLFAALRQRQSATPQPRARKAPATRAKRTTPARKRNAATA